MKLKELLASALAGVLTLSSTLVFSTAGGALYSFSSNLTAKAIEIKDEYDEDKEPEPPVHFQSDITGATVTLSGYNFAYTGEAICPDVKVRRENATKDLVKDTDFTVTYENNVNPGTATVIVTGINKYKGTASTTFTIEEPETQSGTVYYQIKDNGTAIRFIDEVSIETVQAASTATEETSVSRSDTPNDYKSNGVKTITKAYKSIVADGKVKNAADGKCFLISSVVANLAGGDKVKAVFTLDEAQANKEVAIKGS